LPSLLKVEDPLVRSSTKGCDENFLNELLLYLLLPELGFLDEPSWLSETFVSVHRSMSSCAFKDGDSWMKNMQELAWLSDSSVSVPRSLSLASSISRARDFR
jgi:hypothetical protein